jgi:hypothetical protein
VSSRKFVLQPGILIVVFLSTLLFAQSKTPTTNAGTVQEFPVTMRQKVVAGTTPVSTKVEATLTIATLVDGKVLPVGATLLGEVLESIAKSAGAPSRLAIRMDAVRWKGQSLEVRAYLTAWYYPIRITAAEDRSDDRPTGVHGEIGVQTGGPRSSVPYSRPVPPGATPEGSDIPPGPTSTVSAHRVMLKDVDAVHLDNGALALTSTRATIKLDKSTTYVLATGDLSPAK